MREDFAVLLRSNLSNLKTPGYVLGEAFVFVVKGEVPRVDDFILSYLINRLLELEDSLAWSNILRNLPDNVSCLGVHSHACLLTLLVTVNTYREAVINNTGVEGGLLLEQISDELLEFAILDTVQNGLSALLEVPLAE